jgi:signal transduction histidine kinase
MKRGVCKLVSRWLRPGCVWWVLLLWLAVVDGAHAELMTLTRAQVRSQVNGLSTMAEVTLPYNWDIRNAGQTGEAEFEIQFSLTELTTQPWGLYLPSVGNAYEIWLNDALLQRQGDLLHPNGADYARVPRFVVMPPGDLKLSNLLRVYIRADAERRAGLSELIVGPEEEAFAAFNRSHYLRVHGSFAVVVFSLTVGMLGLGLWATQTDYFHPDGPRRNPLYLYAALAELCWTVAVGDALIDDPPLDWPWWSAVPAAAAAAWACSVQLFIIEVAGWGHKPFVIWFRRWLMLLIALSVVLPFWAAAQELPAALAAWHVALAVTFLGFGARVLQRAIGNSKWDHKLVAVALLLNLLVGIWDLWTFRIHPSFPDNSMLRFSSLAFGLTLAIIVIARFKTANHEASNMLGTLNKRIAEKEAELRHSYDKLEIQARDQERVAERTRILRDMHDGVGSHLTLAIRQLQMNGQRAEVIAPTEHTEVLHTLRDALDQLKLTIDAIHLPVGDVTALLANLRYRLEPRMAASGITFVWDVDLLHVDHRLDAAAMRHLQFMLFEALSNVVQHSKAHVVRVEAHATPLLTEPSDQQAVTVRVIDDGQGFDVLTLRKKGLASLHERAASIGAVLEISSCPGRTVVEIKLG